MKKNHILIVIHVPVFYRQQSPFLVGQHNYQVTVRTSFFLCQAYPSEMGSFNRSIFPMLFHFVPLKDTVCIPISDYHAVSTISNTELVL